MKRVAAEAPALAAKRAHPVLPTYAALSSDERAPEAATSRPTEADPSRAERVERLLGAARALSVKLAAMTFSPPVEYVYNVYEYAFESYADYVRKYGGGRCEVLLLGMNPGPFGMVQTGVPFGDVVSCSQWMDVLDWAAADPGPPLPLQHPKRPLLGQRCSNVERSGQRLWSLAKNRWDAPEEFFRRFWVHNYCPLAFVKQSKNGTNFTPDKLSKEERRKLEAACDELLKETIEVLQPRVVVGVGLFAKACAERCAPFGSGITVGSVLHPSPASPLGNGLGKWESIAAQQLQDLGVELPQRRPDAVSVP